MSSLSKFKLLLHDAINADLGIKVEVNGDRDLARQKFYAARSEDILLFESIAICVDPLVPTRLWLLKKGGPNAEDS